jgi:transposase-like protein
VRAGARRPSYTDADRARAVELFAEHGATAAAAEVGCGVRTVIRWAQAAGVISPEERAARTRAARAEVDRRAAEAHATLVPTLTHIASLSLAGQLELVQLVADVLRQAREGGGVDAATMARLSAVTSVVGELTPRTLVAMSTRAIHDLQLLTGGDTERSAAEVRVFLAKLDAEDVDSGGAQIIDLAPVEDAG